MVKFYWFTEVFQYAIKLNFSAEEKALPTLRVISDVSLIKIMHYHAYCDANEYFALIIQFICFQNF